MPAMPRPFGCRCWPRSPAVVRLQEVAADGTHPRVPLYLLGHRLLELRPYVPIFAGVRVAVAVLSYLDTFGFGITADFDSFPDVDTLATGIRRGFDELVAAADEAGQD